MGWDHLLVIYNGKFGDHPTQVVSLKDPSATNCTEVLSIIKGFIASESHCSRQVQKLTNDFYQESFEMFRGVPTACSSRENCRIYDYERGKETEVTP